MTQCSCLSLAQRKTGSDAQGEAVHAAVVGELAEHNLLGADSSRDGFNHASDRQ